MGTPIQTNIGAGYRSDYTGDQIDALLRGQVGTLDELRQLPASKMVGEGHVVRVTEKGRTGLFYNTPTDLYGVGDDDGLQVLASDGTYFVRMWNGEAVKAAWYGLDASTEDAGPQLQALLGIFDAVRLPESEELNVDTEILVSTGGKLVGGTLKYGPNLAAGTGIAPILKVKSAQGLRLEGIHFEGPGHSGDHNDQVMINVLAQDSETADDVVIAGCTFSDSGGRAVYLLSGEQVATPPATIRTQNVRITDCTFRDMNNGVNTFQSGARQVTISDCTFTRMAEVCIKLDAQNEASDGSWNSGYSITGNLFTDLASDYNDQGEYMQSVITVSEKTRNVDISHNIFENIVTDQFILRVTADITTGGDLPCENVSITNNFFSRCSGGAHMIGIDDASVDFNGIRIENNVVEGFYEKAFLYLSLSDPGIVKRLRVAGNVLEDGVQAQFLQLRSRIEDLDVKNNHVRGARIHVHVLNNVKRANVIGNVFTGATDNCVEWTAQDLPVEYARFQSNDWREDPDDTVALGLVRVHLTNATVGAGGPGNAGDIVIFQGNTYGDNVSYQSGSVGSRRNALELHVGEGTGFIRGEVTGEAFQNSLHVNGGVCHVTGCHLGAGNRGMNLLDGVTVYARDNWISPGQSTAAYKENGSATLHDLIAIVQDNPGPGQDLVTKAAEVTDLFGSTGSGSGNMQTVSGTGDDANVNNNFERLRLKINAITTALSNANLMH